MRLAEGDVREEGSSDCDWKWSEAVRVEVGGVLWRLRRAAASLRRSYFLSARRARMRIRSCETV